MKTTVRFGKFERASSHACDDSEADVFVNGELAGTIIASRGNVGSLLCPQWVVCCYYVELETADFEVAARAEFGVRTRQDPKAPYLTPAEAKRAAKVWIAAQTEGGE